MRRLTADGQFFQMSPDVEFEFPLNWMITWKCSESVEDGTWTGDKVSRGFYREAVCWLSWGEVEEWLGCWKGWWKGWMNLIKNVKWMEAETLCSCVCEWTEIALQELDYFCMFWWNKKNSSGTCILLNLTIFTFRTVCPKLLAQIIMFAFVCYKKIK